MAKVSKKACKVAGQRLGTKSHGKTSISKQNISKTASDLGKCSGQARKKK